MNESFSLRQTNPTKNHATHSTALTNQSIQHVGIVLIERHYNGLEQAMQTYHTKLWCAEADASEEASVGR